ncbi:MAG: DUF882 domain-containing protein [Candidatus Binatia bacterium]
MGSRAAVGLLMAPRLASAARQSRSVAFYNLHTSERLTVDYLVNGRYQSDALRAVNRILRDHYSGDVHPIDPGLLDVIWELRLRMESRAPYHVLSGYRSPQTNAMKAREGRGVAPHSFHMQGRAVDLFLPDRDLRLLRRAALSLRAGGVGYYPRPGFVHVDTGPVRTW